MKKEDYKDYFLDLLSHIDGLSTKPMFGGYGIYQHGKIFAFIVEDKLYFKVDEELKEKYLAAGGEQFLYEKGDHKKTAMNYVSVPEEVLEDKAELSNWVEDSVGVSGRK